MIIKKHSLPIIGAILGDIVGAPYELAGTRIKSTDFPLFKDDSTFTDDTVLTLAIAKWILNPKSDPKDIVHELGRTYIDVGFGHSFKKWLRDPNPQPYGSMGNGSAMRVSAIGVTACSLCDTLRLAKESAIITHNHPEGIKGAQAVATAVFFAYQGFHKECIKEYIENEFGYDLSRTVNSIRKDYVFDATCNGSVPEAIIAFLESNSVEDAIRLAVSLGGDADTQASISGAIAAAYYKDIPMVYIDEVLSRLSPDLLEIFKLFNSYTPQNTSSNYKLTAKHDLELDGYIQYTFALAITDKTRIFIPKGTALLINWNGKECLECNIISNKTRIFNIVEKKLSSMCVDKYGETEEPLCRTIKLSLCKDDLKNFAVREAVIDDVLCLL
jgi:ADP-ribosylglycohydrolase